MTKMENLKMAFEVLQTLATLDMTAVPIEPNEAMVAAGVKASGLKPEAVKEIYAAMLLASDDTMPL